MFKIVAEYPAYKLIRKLHYTFRDGDKIAVPYTTRKGDTLYNFYQLGSVAGYAIKNGECPFEAVERAKEFGHDLHYAFGLGVCLSAGPVAQKVVAYVEMNDVIRAFGKFWQIMPAPNNNIKLEELPDFTEEEWRALIIEEVKEG